MNTYILEMAAQARERPIIELLIRDETIRVENLQRTKFFRENVPE